MNKGILFFLFFAFVLTVDASAAGSTDTLNNYLDIVGNLIGDKIQIIGITIVMIFSAIMAWKNASVSPLGWGAAASIAIAGSGSIAGQLKDLTV